MTNGDETGERARTTATRISRRSLLQRSLFGAAALGAFPLPAQAARTTAQGVAIDAFEGLLLDKGPGLLVVERYGAPVRVPLTRAAELWRGGLTSLDAFLEGDQVLVRTVDGTVTNAWANLTKVRGLVTGRTPDGYEVGQEGSPSSIEIVLDGLTAVTDALSGQPTLPAQIPVGTWVDVAGLAVDGGIVASNARYVLPDAKPLHRSGPPRSSRASPRPE